MTKEQEIMDFLNEKVFEPILSAKDLPAGIKAGVNLTKARINKLTAEKMVQFFWSALVNENGLAFADKIKAEKLPRFEDVCDEFKKRFTEDWLKK